jgi:hypothetical protein
MKPCLSAAFVGRLQRLLAETPFAPPAAPASRCRHGGSACQCQISSILWTREAPRRLPAHVKSRERPLGDRAVARSVFELRLAGCASCALFIAIISKNTRDRDEGYFRLESKLAVDRCHLMAADRTFLLPVVIDETRDDHGRVPERFREVQWTRLPGGETPPAFVERVRRLLAPTNPQAPAPRHEAPYSPSAATPPARALASASWSKRGPPSSPQSCS